jgi:hypothetical protein
MGPGIPPAAGTVKGNERNRLVTGVTVPANDIGGDDGIGK